MHPEKWTAYRKKGQRYWFLPLYDPVGPQVWMGKSGAGPVLLCWVWPGALVFSSFDAETRIMLTQEATYCFDASSGMSGMANEALNTVVEEIEAELCTSALYEQAAYTLRKMPVELGKQLQLMLKAIGREAIRLSLRKLLHVALPDTPAFEVNLGTRSPKSTKLAELNLAQTEEAALVSSLETAIALPAAIGSVPAEFPPQPVPAPEQPDVLAEVTPLPQAVLANQPKTTIWQRLSKLKMAELADQAAAQAWEERLKEIGADLCRERKARGISLAQIHSSTFIPMHILEALETGDTAHLPEDIYIRGFLRQVGSALGLDGRSLADSLPSPLLDPTKAVLPTWYTGTGKIDPSIRPLHVYAGYAALLVAGIGWVSYQTAPKVQPVSPVQAPPSVQTPETKQSNQQTPNAKKAIANIAQPETFVESR